MTMTELLMPVSQPEPLLSREDVRPPTPSATASGQSIDHLHARTKEFINTLIAVTSRLDAVVTSMNVLNPMENQ